MIHLRILAQVQSLPRLDRRYFDRSFLGQFCVVFAGCCFVVVEEVSYLYISEEFAYLDVVVA